MKVKRTFEAKRGLPFGAVCSGFDVFSSGDAELQAHLKSSPACTDGALYVQGTGGGGFVLWISCSDVTGQKIEGNRIIDKADITNENVIYVE